ncbi:MAG: metal-dependent transcriptional regulator [Clostridia bacterium]|nr:metal-dependent transcriptional regulator [Clostridia bacterium]
MSIQESGEMYLESILVLSGKGAVRSIDIVEYMNYSKPSVSRAVGILKKDGYITVDKSGYIELTSSGREIAQKIYDRHKLITGLLEMLGVDKETASEDACKIEHHLSDKSFEAIKKHLENYKK